VSRMGSASLAQLRSSIMFISDPPNEEKGLDPGSTPSGCSQQEVRQAMGCKKPMSMSSVATHCCYTEQIVHTCCWLHIKEHSRLKHVLQIRVMLLPLQHNCTIAALATACPGC
jgi:hypothetical protein